MDGEHMTRIAISIAHKPTPERVRTLERMIAAIDLPSHGDTVAGIYLESAPGKPHEWSERQWYGATTYPDATHAVFLNDDLTLCDDFVTTLVHVLEARPSHIIHLGNAEPAAADADARGLRWLTSRNGLIGNGYAMPMAGLHDFLRWRSDDVLPSVVERTSEDFLVNLYAMARGALIWHCVPALYALPRLPSCYGNERNHGRACVVNPRPGMAAIDWDTDAFDVGTVRATEAFAKNHYKLVSGLRTPLIDRYFECAGD